MLDIHRERERETYTERERERESFHNFKLKVVVK